MPKKVETELECPPFQTKGEALRWVLHGPELALPSVDRTSYAAMEKLRGRVDNRSPMADDSGIPSRRKLDLLTAAHEDASHIGGRAAVPWPWPRRGARGPTSYSTHSGSYIVV